MFNFFFYPLLFLFGGAVGSFINVIVDRLYIKSFWGGRSVCQSCSKKLSWYEMIPVLSFIFLKGRCHKCKVHIGWKHFWIEFILGMLAILTYKFLLIDYFSIFASSSIIWTGILLALFYAFIFILLFVVLLYDLKHKIVPIQFSLLIILVGISFEAYRVYNYLAIYSEFSTLFWLDLFSGFLISLPFLIIFLLSRGKAVGFGDIMLLFGVGYITGFIFGVSTFLLSIWIGAIVSLIMLYLFPKKYNRKSEIPFAPFIVIATVLMIFLEIDFIGLSMFLY